jgi:hypothetical protein
LVRHFEGYAMSLPNPASNRDLGFKAVPFGDAAAEDALKRRVM